MFRLPLLRVSPASVFASTAAVLVSAGVAWSQPELPRGFAKDVPAHASGEERNRQTDLRVMEVQFKPMRMIWAEITNPETGVKERKEVWYLLYRAIARPAAGRQDETDTRPVNVVDAAPQPTMFMPEFVLTVFDDPEFNRPESSHLDQVLPEAVEAIRAVEQRPAYMFEKRKIENSLSIVQPFPDPIAPEAPAEEQDWVYGVATWSDIDPETDYLQVTLRGFTNAFEMRPAPDGSLQPWRKIISQQFSRRGDRFDPNQKEFEFIGEPHWEYQPDSTLWSEWRPPAQIDPAVTRR